MEKKTFHIPNISCGHCTAAIANELNEIKGITAVQGDIPGKNISVEWTAPVTEEKILEILKEIGYPAAG